MDDIQLIYGLRSGNNRVLSMLVEKYKDRLYSLCLHLERNCGDAEDLFQDTWLKVIEKIELYDVSRPFWSWLASIAANTYRDKYRRLKKRLLLFVKADRNNEEEIGSFIENVASSDGNPEADMVSNEFRENLVKCLNKMDDKYRIPLILQYYRDMRYEDIASAVGIKTGTVKSRLNEAKRRLRVMMEVKYGEG